MARFRALDVARAIADEINKLLGNRKLSMIHRAQLRKSAQSIPANIREGMGWKPGPERNKAYRYACGSAEETDEHLRSNYEDGRVAGVVYRRIHNRVALLLKLLDPIINS